MKDINDIYIDINIDKDPYIKTLTDDKIINITGESGSGKSYFSNQYLNNDNYIVIDTDIVFSNKDTDNLECIELRKIFGDKQKDYLFTNFDEFYLKTRDYFKNSTKTLVIDSAQYRNIKNYSILKGKIIIMRTSIDTCYERTLNRWKSKNDFNEEEFNKFAEKKKGIYEWYHSLNTFIENIDKM